MNFFKYSGVFLLFANTFFFLHWLTQGEYAYAVLQAVGVYFSGKLMN